MSMNVIVNVGTTNYVGYVAGHEISIAFSKNEKEKDLSHQTPDELVVRFWLPFEKCSVSFVYGVIWFDNIRQKKNQICENYS